MSTSLRIYTVIASCTVLSCTGTDVGNGFVDVDMVLYDSAGSSSRSQSTVAPDGLVVTEAWVAVDRVRLRRAAPCDDTSVTELAGPYAVNMLARGSVGELQGIEVETTGYCRFELRWDELDEAGNGAPAELVGASIYIAGTRQDGTEFVLRSRRNDELRLDARDGAFTIDAMTHALFVAFDVQNLFDGVDIDNADIGADDTIRIEEGSNEVLLDQFDANLAVSADLFDDDDDSGDLEAGERDDADTLAD